MDIFRKAEEEKNHRGSLFLWDEIVSEFFTKEVVPVEYFEDFVLYYRDWRQAKGYVKKVQFTTSKYGVKRLFEKVVQDFHETNPKWLDRGNFLAPPTDIPETFWEELKFSGDMTRVVMAESMRRILLPSHRLLFNNGEDKWGKKESYLASVFPNYRKLIYVMNGVPVEQVKSPDESVDNFFGDLGKEMYEILKFDKFKLMGLYLRDFSGIPFTMFTFVGKSWTTLEFKVNKVQRLNQSVPYLSFNHAIRYLPTLVLRTVEASEQPFGKASNFSYDYWSKRGYITDKRGVSPWAAPKSRKKS